MISMYIYEWKKTHETTDIYEYLDRLNVSRFLNKTMDWEESDILRELPGLPITSIE